MAKLDIYRKFATALIVSVLVSVGWIGYEVCLFMSKTYSNSRNIKGVLLHFTKLDWFLFSVCSWRSRV